MKKIVFLFFVLVQLSGNAQSLELKDFSENQELNYILANLIPEETQIKKLYDSGLYVKIIEYNDPQKTPESLFEGYEGMLSSILISIRPDGDLYTTSKLYKIEGMYEPVVQEIKETSFPFFTIRIEYGFYDEKQVEEFILSGE